MHCLLARFCFTYVLCVTLSRGLQIDEAAAAAASLEAWGGAARREREAAAGLMQLAVSPPATRPAPPRPTPAWAPPAASAAPSPPIWGRLEELPDPVGVPRATSTPVKGHQQPIPRRRLRRREWKPLERVSV